MYTSESGVMQISHDPRLHDPDPGPQEKSTEKSCVSFGKDCNKSKVHGPCIWLPIFSFFVQYIGIVSEQALIPDADQ